MINVIILLNRKKLVWSRSMSISSIVVRKISTRNLICLVLVQLIGGVREDLVEVLECLRGYTGSCFFVPKLGYILKKLFLALERIFSMLKSEDIGGGLREVYSSLVGFIGSKFEALRKTMIDTADYMLERMGLFMKEILSKIPYDRGSAIILDALLASIGVISDILSRNNDPMVAIGVIQVVRKAVDNLPIDSSAQRYVNEIKRAYRSLIRNVVRFCRELLGFYDEECIPRRHRRTRYTSSRPRKETWMTEFIEFYFAGRGDVNNDGISDIILGATGSRTAKIYYGNETPNTHVDAILEGAGTDNRFGYSTSSAGDFNNDGYEDLIVGAYGYNDYRGRSYIYYGGENPDNEVDITFASEDIENSNYGWSVAGIGDINNDGYDDVAVGAIFYATNLPGKVYVYYGVCIQ